MLFTTINNPKPERIPCGNVLLVGYGKMGRLIHQCLEAFLDYEHLFICDLSFGAARTEGRKEFFSDIARVEGVALDCAFVVTPAEYHCAVVKQLAGFGVKNFFVEKPAVLTREEFDEVMGVAPGCRIATGYILRHADSIKTMNGIIDDLLAGGFSLERCDVEYSKFLPATAEPRAMTDLGVFEELPHVWDLLFNYLKRSPKDVWTEVTAEFAPDPAKADRCIEATLEYEGFFAASPAKIRIHSSFRSEERTRRFQFRFVGKKGGVILLTVDLDDSEFCDHVAVSDGTAELYSSSFTSLKKLQQELAAAIRYFQTGDSGNLSLFENEEIIIRLLTR